MLASGQGAFLNFLAHHNSLTSPGDCGMQAYRGLIDAAVAAGIPEDTILDLRGNHDVSSPRRPWKLWWAPFLIAAATHIHLMQCLALCPGEVSRDMEAWGACFDFVSVLTV